EIAGASCRRDYAELVVQSLAHIRRESVAVSLACAGFCQLDQIIVLALRSRREGKRGNLIFLGELNARLVSDQQSVFENICAIRERGSDLVGILEVKSSVVTHPIVGREVFAESDTKKNVVGVVIRGAEKMRIVRCDDGNAKLLRQTKDSRAQLGLAFGVARLHLEVLVRESVLVPL